MFVLLILNKFDAQVEFIFFSSSLHALDCLCRHINQFKVHEILLMSTTQNYNPAEIVLSYLSCSLKLVVRSCPRSSVTTTTRSKNKIYENHTIIKAPSRLIRLLKINDNTM